MQNFQFPLAGLHGVETGADGVMGFVDFQFPLAGLHDNHVNAQKWAEPTFNSLLRDYASPRLIT